MKAKSILLGGATAAAMALVGPCVAQQTNSGTTATQSPAVLGSPGMQSGGGYKQVAPNEQRGYPAGGRMQPGSYNPRAAQNGLTPVRHLPNSDPYGTGAAGGGMRTNVHPSPVPTTHHS
jgi:hypothetical protein